MSQLTGDERASYIHNVFGRVARRYNLMNRLMTAGQDIHWRREAIRRLGLPPARACWTWEPAPANLGREALRQQPDIRWWRRISAWK